MPGLSARIVLLINRLFPTMAMHEELEAVKWDEAAYADWELHEGEVVVQDFAPYWDIESKAVLDVGSGLGGKPALYQRLGARSVTGIDLRPVSARWAQGFVAAQAQGRERIRFVVCDAAQLPFQADAFDAVVSINVFEHVEQPLAVLSECLRVCRPSGRVYLRFPPWYGPWAPHLDGWINWPWPHLFFSERTLIEAANHVEAEKHLNRNLIPSGQLDLRGRTTLPELNRVTIRQFEEMLRLTGARVLSLQLVPPGYRFLATKGPLGRALLALLNAGTRMPLLREVLTTKIICVLAKGTTA